MLNFQGNFEVKQHTSAWVFTVALFVSVPFPASFGSSNCCKYMLKVISSDISAPTVLQKGVVVLFRYS